MTSVTLKKFFKETNGSMKLKNTITEITSMVNGLNRRMEEKVSVNLNMEQQKLPNFNNRGKGDCKKWTELQESQDYIQKHLISVLLVSQKKRREKGKATKVQIQEA